MEESKEKNSEVYEFKGVGLTLSEKRHGQKLFDGYRLNNHIDNINDFPLLEDLVYREIIQERYKKQIAKVNKSKKVKEENIIPKYVLTALNENSEQILLLREKLGLFEVKKEKDAYTHIQLLKKKFNIWLSDNQGSRTLPCPHCSKIIMLKIRTEAWEALKHPFFKDRILANKHLWKCYKEGKITKEDVAEILGCSPDYIEWLEKHLYKPSNLPNNSPDKV